MQIFKVIILQKLQHAIKPSGRLGHLFICCVSHTVTNRNKVNATYKYLDDHYIRTSTFTNIYNFPSIFRRFSGVIQKYHYFGISCPFPGLYIHNLPCDFRECYNCEMPRTAKLFKARIRIRCEFEECV